MAKQYTTTDATLYVPGGYPRTRVQSSPGGLATSGVLAVIGEADSGPSWSEESDLSAVTFGPDQYADVAAKFGGGRLVDAMRGAVNASADSAIPGNFSSIMLLKTNVGTKASTALLTLGSGLAYGTLRAKLAGVASNQNRVSVTEGAEVKPSVTFTYIPAVGTVDLAIRTNGSSAAPVNVAANRVPNSFVTDVDAAAGVDATGGVNRNILTVSGTVQVAVVSGNTVTFTRSIPWATTPSVGDTLIVPATAPSGLRDPAGGATDENVGAYVVTAATSTVITAIKLSDAGRTGAVAGTITAPAATTAVSVAAVTDVACYSPVTIALTGTTVLPGVAKTLEIAELVSGGDLLSRVAYQTGTTTPVTWISKSTAGVLITSSAESTATLRVTRAPDRDESYTVGGEIGLNIGYSGGAITVTVSATTLTTSAGLSVNLADHSTLQGLADFISAQAGYTASPGNASIGFLPPTALDRVTTGISSQFGNVAPGKIKVDAKRMADALGGSALVEFAARPAAGLPAVTAAVFMTGGARGATSNTNVAEALDALADESVNFIVPLFSTDAAQDIANGDTDGSSSYSLDSITALVKAHVIAAQSIKARKNRQGFLSIDAAFAAQQQYAANVARYDQSVSFLSCRDVNSRNEIVAFQPWMIAVKAAAMQAAGLYRSITKKKLNVSSVFHRVGDFSPKKLSHVENALKAGLLPVRQARTGGYEFVSDQTTYGADDNFVFNSIQAVYAANLVSITASQRMEDSMVGQSVADISASVAITYLDLVMSEFLRLKLISPSDDAARGYRNARVRIVGNVMLISVEIKLATAIDFIVIDFSVSPVVQSA